MEKAAVVGNAKGKVEEILKKEGFVIDEMAPQVVFSVGGDGTFMIAEAQYPGVPKIFIKHSWDCKKCRHNFKPIIKLFKEGKYKIVELFKLEAKINGQEQKALIAFNDINIHYSPPTALRFTLSINDKKHTNIAIGDGAVISTPYGSTGYYHSITRKAFKKGIGIAFNNLREPVKNCVVKSDSVITINIQRGPGKVFADSIRKILDIKDGDVITIRKAIGKAFIIKLEGHDLKVVNY
ncbi:MAG: hypothetical protein ABIB71_05290 [Candidatus Woesearchaeota archaeon]